MAAAFVLALTASAPIGAVEPLHIETNSNPAYLPYDLDSIAGNDFGQTVFPDHGRLHVAFACLLGEREGVIGVGSNFPPPTENDHRVSLVRYPSWTVHYELPVNCVLSDWSIYGDSASGTTEVLIAGYSDDSVFLYKASCFSDSVERKVLGLLDRQRWPVKPGRKPNVLVSIMSDRADLANSEALVFVEILGSVRMLYCVDTDTMMIKWNLPVSSPPVEFVCMPPDCSHRELTFVTTNPGNGMKDSEFDDQYKYLFSVNSTGKIIYKKILACRFEQYANLCPAETEDELYVAHALDFVDTADSSDFDVKDHYISKIRSDGTQLESTKLPGNPQKIYLIPFGATGSLHLWVRMKGRGVIVYDTSLSLVAYDSLASIGAYFGRMKIPGESDSVYAFGDGLYDNTLSKILSFPLLATSVEPVSYDSSGNVVDIGIDAQNRFYVGRIRKKTYLNLASVFFVRNQVFVLNALFVLLASLLTMTYFRWKAKQKLQVLTLAQDALVAEEKYKQAREIAGGFAHEIRNALFPADGLLTKLRRLDNSGSPDANELRKFHEDTHAAISRAISITELISVYTKLESEYLPETTDLGAAIANIIDANQLRINDQGVTLTAGRIENVFVTCNRQQFEILTNNLLLNSLDALEGVGNPQIKVDVNANSRSVVLTFADNGIGIESNAIGKIFDAFHSTKPTTGIGLGLSMVKKIVEMYGGTVSVRSEAGRGTEFEITMRRANG